MDSIIENFLEISKIKRCSYNTEEVQNYIINFAKECGYEVKRDRAGNILATTNDPSIALQAHIDMVCIGKTPPEIKINGNIIRAKNSSLGADNGIAVAMMLELMRERREVEFLFTNDEEVGLIGAKNIDLELKAKYMLNLDSEEEGDVYIGCAGGVDLKISKIPTLKGENLKFFEIYLREELAGGHSGVDIDKNIPDANLELLKFIKDNSLKIVEFQGGERINSISTYAKATVGGSLKPKSTDLIEVKELQGEFKTVDLDIEPILKLKYKAISYSREFNVVEDSRNLSIVTINRDKIEILISNRSIKNDNLKRLEDEVRELFRDFKVEILDRYFAWQPEINRFSEEIKEILGKEFGKSQYKVIHAGLECGVLKERYPHIKFASIGPNIFFPHSKKEHCEIDSIKRTFKALRWIVK